MSLYNDLASKPYPSNQYMDIESIKWLKEKLKISHTYEWPVFSKKFPLEKIEVNYEVFEKHNGYSIHGFRHQIRVALYTWIVAQMYDVEISEGDLLGLVQGAIYHDIMRENDNTDPDHGKRSAEWVHNRYPNLNNGIIKAIELHNASIEIVENNPNVFLRVLRFADALDRYRLPKEKWWIKTELFDFCIGEKQLDIFKYITYNTELILYFYNDISEMGERMFAWLKEKKLI